MKGINNGRKLSEILKDRRFFSEEQEQAIHKAVTDEIKKYTNKSDIKNCMDDYIQGEQNDDK